ncbi:MAG TPA: hypothetical protein VM759_12805 [Longimicrobium sp.]|nr:hypothetical protein [Longimicrobium sp.]
MKKLRLDIEALTVETFDTDDSPGGRGTVLAHAPYTYMCESAPECVTDWSCEGGQTRCAWACSTPPVSNDVSCLCT